MGANGDVEKGYHVIHIAKYEISINIFSLFSKQNADDDDFMRYTMEYAAHVDTLWWYRDKCKISCT